MSYDDSPNPLKIVLVVIWWLYCISAQVMAVIFWIDYYEKHSLLRFIFVDSFIAELKGLVWPFFI